MSDVILGLLALAVGALFCFRGYLTMRLVIPVWGAFAGFLLGAGLVNGFSNSRFLVGALSWVVGIAVGLLFAVFAYAYYEVSVVLAMAATGFVLGATLMVALNVTWTWVVIVVGVLAGLALAVLAILADLPMILLVVLTAMAGAATLVAGCMLVAGSLNTADVGSVERSRDQHAPGDKRGSAGHCGQYDEQNHGEISEDGQNGQCQPGENANHDDNPGPGDVERHHEGRAEDKSGRRHGQNDRNLVVSICEDGEQQPDRDADHPGQRTDQKPTIAESVDQPRTEQETGEGSPDWDHEAHRQVTAEAEQRPHCKGQQAENDIAHECSSSRLSVILARRRLRCHPAASGGAGEARTRPGAGSRWAVSDESEALACRP